MPEVTAPEPNSHDEEVVTTRASPSTAIPPLTTAKANLALDAATYLLFTHILQNALKEQGMLGARLRSYDNADVCRVMALVQEQCQRHAKLQRVAEAMSVPGQVPSFKSVIYIVNTNWRKKAKYSSVDAVFAASADKPIISEPCTQAKEDPLHDSVFLYHTKTHVCIEAGVLASLCAADSHFSDIRRISWDKFLERVQDLGYDPDAYHIVTRHNLIPGDFDSLVFTQEGFLGAVMRMRLVGPAITFFLEDKADIELLGTLERIRSNNSMLGQKSPASQTAGKARQRPREDESIDEVGYRASVLVAEAE